MAEPLQCRAELLEAMEALHQVHASLLRNDERLALRELDKATVILAEVRKTISTTGKR